MNAWARHTMSPMMLLARVTHILSWERHDARSMDQQVENHHVGAYRADYSEPDLDAWRAPDYELEDLIANSKSILDQSDAR